MTAQSGTWDAGHAARDSGLGGAVESLALGGESFDLDSAENLSRIPSSRTQAASGQQLILSLAGNPRF